MPVDFPQAGESVYLQCHLYAALQAVRAGGYYHEGVGPRGSAGSERRMLKTAATAESDR